MIARVARGLLGVSRRRAQGARVLLTKALGWKRFE